MIEPLFAAKPDLKSVIKTQISLDVRILRATAQDLSTIKGIHDELRRPIRSDYKANEYFMACVDGVAVGCAGTSLHLDGGYFYGLAVRRKWQRQGVGSLLMQARVDALLDIHADYAVALAMFWNSRFFRKHGFSPVKRNMLPSTALFHSELTNPAYARSAAMLRYLKRT